MRFVLLFVILLTFKSFSQTIGGLHGTQIIALICDDGIIMAADSRSSYKKYYVGSTNEFCYAYVDSFKKIFNFGRFQMAITGLSNPKEDSWEKILRIYNKKKTYDTLIEKAYDNFIIYLKEKLKIADSIINQNRFLICGFENRNPVIFAANSFFRRRGDRISYMLISDTCALKTLRESISTNCADISTAVENSMVLCSNADVMIGGPIHMIKIKSDNSVEQVKKFKFLPNETNSQIKKMILDGKMDVKYLYPESKEYLMKVLTKDKEEKN